MIAWVRVSHHTQKFKKKMKIIILLTILSITNAFTSCQDDPIKDLPFCDISLSFEQRVEDLLPRLNVSEKISQFGMGKRLRFLALVQRLDLTTTSNSQLERAWNDGE